MKVQLTLKERKLIRRVVKIQLDTLKAMLENDCGEDIELWCIKEEIEQGALRKLIRKNIIDFRMIYFKPEQFLDLSSTHLSTFKHILQTVIPKHQKTKRGIWRKIFINEDLEFHLHHEVDSFNLN